MKKIIFTLFFLLTLNVYAVDKSTTYSTEVFNKAQKDGKLVVINSWQETCVTCRIQIEFLDKAEKDFKGVVFLSFDQERDTEIAKKLKVDYWTTILIFKDNEEVYRSIGQTDKDKIYSIINSFL
tara:strand:+ start:97 stop:468 length:372 start_codon:yes stop_codon:yes gene_type:complete